MVAVARVVVVLVHAALAGQVVEVPDELLVTRSPRRITAGVCKALSPCRPARRLPVPWKVTCSSRRLREKAANWLWLMLSGSSVMHERLHWRDESSRPTSRGFGQGIRRVIPAASCFAFGSPLSSMIRTRTPRL